MLVVSRCGLDTNRQKMVSIKEIEWSECRGKPTVDAIKQFEVVIGRELPETLKVLLDTVNGGSPSHDIFSYKDPETYQEIRSCLGALISFNSEDENNILDYLSRPSEGMSSELAPFAAIGNGNLICLKKNSECVFIWLHGNRSGYDECQLADTFQEFIEGLQQDNDDEDEDLDTELANLEEE